MRTQSFKNNSGFTLIELLVVIAIIGVLSAIVFASLNNARMRARDARRIGDMNQIRNALNLYYDTNRVYPSVATWFTSTANTCTWIPGLSPAYMSCVSKDPLNITCVAVAPTPVPTGVNGPWTGGTNYCYAYSAPGSSQDYDLVTLLEDTTNIQRCAVKHWFYRTLPPPTGPASWCAPTGANGGVGFSPFMYANH